MNFINTDVERPDILLPGRCGFGQAILSGTGE